MFHFVIFHINQPCVSTCTWYSKKKRFFDASMMVCVCVWNNGCAKWRQESLSKEVYNELYFFFVTKNLFRDVSRLYDGNRDECRDPSNSHLWNFIDLPKRMDDHFESRPHNHTRNVWYMVTRANTYRQTNKHFLTFGFRSWFGGQKRQKTSG